METNLHGVCPVLVTPFWEDGSLDFPSLRRQIEHNIAFGVDALVCFGLASEAHTLSDDERQQVLGCSIETVAGRVPVVVGVDHTGVESAAARAKLAAAAGASAVMAYPPTFVRPDAAGVLDFYTSVAHATSLPVVVQDAPLWTGVPLPVDLITKMREHAPNIRYVKVEAPPTAPKVATLVGQGFQTIGGYGALHLAEELRAGIIGTMPGSALPGLYRDLWKLAQANSDDFWGMYARALPLLVYQMSSLELFISVQKILLVRCGFLATAHLRRPSTQLVSRQVDWLDELLIRTGISSYLQK